LVKSLATLEAVPTIILSGFAQEGAFPVPPEIKILPVDPGLTGA
jgi:hypothetical protein